MPIELTLKSNVILDDIWGSKEDFEEIFANNLNALREMLKEDCLAFLEDCGGVEGLVISARWVEVKP